MKASSVMRRVLASADARKWAWWQLDWLLRVYIGAVTLVYIALACFAASQTTWTGSDLWKFALLLGCGLVSVAATPRMAYLQGGITRDFIAVWVLPVAILLPPVYAMVTPIPLYLLTQWWVFRGLVYRRVFTVAAIGLAYGTASVLFHAFPASFAGPTIGTGRHALTWAVAVVISEQVGRRGHQGLVAPPADLLADDDRHGPGEGVPAGADRRAGERLRERTEHHRRRPVGQAYGADREYPAVDDPALDQQLGEDYQRDRGHHGIDGREQDRDRQHPHGEEVPGHTALDIGALRRRRDRDHAAGEQ